MIKFKFKELKQLFQDDNNKKLQPLQQHPNSNL